MTDRSTGTAATGRVEGEETRCQEKCRHYLSFVFFLPVFFFVYDLSNKEWIDSDTGTSENLHLHWKRWVYFLVASLSGTIGGVILTCYPTAVDKEWFAGAMGGAVGAPCALGASVLYLDLVNHAFSIVMFITACLGSIPGVGVYYFIKQKCLVSQQDHQWHNAVELPTSEAEMI